MTSADPMFDTAITVRHVHFATVSGAGGCISGGLDVSAVGEESERERVREENVMRGILTGEPVRIREREGGESCIGWKS